MRPAELHKTVLGVFPPTEPGGPPIKAIVKHTSQGELRAVQAVIPLSPDRGDTYPISARIGGEWKKVQSITAQGYFKLNAAVGVSFVAPETLKDNDGKTRPNPYIHRDETGKVLTVRTRQIGIGRAPTGTLVMHDLTIELNLPMNLAQDLWSKWTGRKQDSPKDWGRPVPENSPRPADLEGNWAPYPMLNGVTLYVNLADKDAIAALGEHINRQRFAERTAVTVCQRNVLRRFIPVTKLDASMAVPVVGWFQPDRELKELTQAAANANAGQTAIGNELAEVIQETSTDLPQEDIEAAVVDDPDMAPPAEDAPEPAVDPTPQQQTAPDPHALKRTAIRQQAELLGAEKADEILGSVGIEGIHEVAFIDDEQVLDAGLEALREAAKKKPAPAATLPAKVQAGTERLFNDPIAPGTQPPAKKKAATKPKATATP